MTLFNKIIIFTLVTVLFSVVAFFSGKAVFADSVQITPFIWASGSDEFTTFGAGPYSTTTNIASDTKYLVLVVLNTGNYYLTPTLATQSFTQLSQRAYGRIYILEDPPIGSQTFTLTYTSNRSWKMSLFQIRGSSLDYKKINSFQWFYGGTSQIELFNEYRPCRKIWFTGKQVISGTTYITDITNQYRGLYTYLNYVFYQTSTEYGLKAYTVTQNISNSAWFDIYSFCDLNMPLYVSSMYSPTSTSTSSFDMDLTNIEFFLGFFAFILGMWVIYKLLL